MKGSWAMVGWALAVVLLAGWTAASVVGQPSTRPRPAFPAPAPRTPAAPESSTSDRDSAPGSISGADVPAAPDGTPAPVRASGPASRGAMPPGISTSPAAPAPAGLPFGLVPPAAPVVKPNPLAPAVSGNPVVPASPVSPLTPVTPAVPSPAAPEREPAARNPGLEVGQGPTVDNPTGRQTPAVSIEWIGPPTAKIGQPVTYQMIVKNVSPSSSPVHQVVVQCRLPQGVTVNATEPKATVEGHLLSWSLGSIPSRQERRLDVQLVPETKGDLLCPATVVFAGASVARIKVREPKLMVKVAAPDKVLMGDAASIIVTVSNPGDDMADNVKVKATLSEGLEHARGKVIEFNLGNVEPNGSRSVQLACTAKQGGEQKCEAVAVAEGDLNAKDQAAFQVIAPNLELTVSGPGLRYLDRQATYVFKVTNPGNAPASNVTIADQLPQGFKFLSASDGGRHDFATRTVSWFVGDLAPGQSREVSLQVLAINAGEHKHKGMAIAARGLKAETEAMTRVEGLPALLMELVDIDDPVEVGADTSYEIRVTNTGSKTETNLQLTCFIPDEMELRGAHGAAGCQHRIEGKQVVFEPLPKLAARADAIYRINVRGMHQGDLRFRAEIKADGLRRPVIKEESTKVYADEAVPTPPVTTPRPPQRQPDPSAPRSSSQPEASMPRPALTPEGPLQPQRQPLRLELQPQPQPPMVKPDAPAPQP